VAILCVHMNVKYKRAIMFNPKWKLYRVAQIICVISVVGFFVPHKKLFAETTQASTKSQGYYTGDKIPGDPDNEVQVMKHIYKYVQIYRERHEGSYPISATGPGSFDEYFSSKLTSFGFKTLDDVKRAIVNPDNQYDDSPFVRKDPNTYVLSSYPTLRPDGRTIGSPRPKGTRDVISNTSTYYHQNPLFLNDPRPYANPVGYHMVLWDDGTIEKVPYDSAFYMSVETSDGQSYSVVFPTQAGLPWNCITYAEYQTGIHIFKTKRYPHIGYPLAPGQTDPKPDNGGIESLVWLTRLLDLNIMRTPIWDALGHQVKDFTLQEIADGAAKIDVPLQKKTITLDELQKLHTPTILYLSDAARMVTMSAIDDNHVIIYDRGMTLNIPRAELAKRYSGEALIAASVNAPSALVADQPIRTLDFSSTDAEVAQTVKITNTGKKAVSLIIERPLCGITEAKLSQDNLAPGASANVELHFKWRTVLPGDHQSTFVTLKTDDPAQPRLQLGFDLKLAEAAK